MVISFLFCNDFVMFWYQTNSGLTAWSGMYSLFFNFMEGCLLNWYYFFLKNLVEITTEVIWTWSLFCWKLLTTNLVSLIDIEMLGILVSFCVIFRRLCISNHKIFHISLLFFNIYRICRIVMSFIPDAANLSFFPLVCLTRGLSI